MLEKFLSGSLFLVFLCSLAFASVDVNINSFELVDSNRYVGFTNQQRGFMLDFNVFDNNAAMMDLNAIIAFGDDNATDGFTVGGTAIAGNGAFRNDGVGGFVYDLNLMDMNVNGTCFGGTAFNTSPGLRCQWWWDFNYPAESAGYLDGNKTVDINVFEYYGSTDPAIITDDNSSSKTFYLDTTVPDVNTAVPVSNTTVSTSAPVFKASNVWDANAGFGYCTAFVELDNSGITTSSSVTPSGSACSKTVTLAWMQLAEVDFRGFDRSGNYADLNTAEFEYSLAGGASISNITEGGSSWTEPSAVAPAPAIEPPPQLPQAFQAAQPQGIPFVSDIVAGFMRVLDMLLSFFRFS